MKNEPAAATKIIIWVTLAIWAGLFLLPLAEVFVQQNYTVGDADVVQQSPGLWLKSFGLAGLIAVAAVVLGYLPGRLLGTSRSGSCWFLMILLMPLVLPRYVLYYAWSLLSAPTTELGRAIAANAELARFVGWAGAGLVLILWYWPLAALLIGQGWRNLDRQIFMAASLDADNRRRFTKITLPLLARPMLLALGVCFVLALSEFATFHLAGVKTIGTELAVLYELTGSSAAVVRAAWPVGLVALAVAVILSWVCPGWSDKTSTLEPPRRERSFIAWLVTILLLAISLLVPLVLLIGNLSSVEPFVQFFSLHLDGLAWSLAIATVAALGAYLLAWGTMVLGDYGKFGKWLAFMVRFSIFFMMFIPASLPAASLLSLLSAVSAGQAVRQSWLLVCAGQVVRFAGVGLIVLLLSRDSRQKVLTEMTRLDTASRVKTFFFVHLRQSWPIFVGTFLLLVMFSLTELSATMVLLPAGLPNFAQRLLNQMHYARDQQVIVSCLALVGLFMVLTLIVVVLFHARKLTRSAMLIAMSFCILAVGGCKDALSGDADPEVIDSFGALGRGQGQFTYPRAIEMAGDNSVFVVDKTGRIQHFDGQGNFLDQIDMPQTEAGKPVGLSIAPDGNLYVADTHYHRVVVFSSDGKLIHEFGNFGETDGCFIYPTDVAFAGDGRIFVSEYGGNDRISVFNRQFEFLYSFGRAGSESGELSRPGGLAVDNQRQRLYVADACNHRIAVYDFDGNLIRYFGSVGRGAGQLRYPYDLDILENGTLLVCEYGNNRIQSFDSDGNSLAVFGRAGRQPGKLAYPWGLAVDEKNRVYIVDAGNNRIQIWQL